MCFETLGQPRASLQRTKSRLFQHSKKENEGGFEASRKRKASAFETEAEGASLTLRIEASYLRELKGASDPSVEGASKLEGFGFEGFEPDKAS